MRIGYRLIVGTLAAAMLAGGGAMAQSRPAPAKAVTVAEETALYHFEYAYPAAAAAIPALKARLDAKRSEARASIRKDAIDGKKMAAEDGFDFNPYFYSTNWLVVTNLPGWLSLSAMSESFTGGAHGMRWASGLLWDKAAARERAVTDLFISKAAFSAAIRRPFCDRLDAERAERRGEPVRRNSGDEFDACIDPADSTVLLGSADKAHFTRIGIEVDPYAAGPYVEGNYSITVPVTPAVINALRPEYRAAFAVVR